MAIHTGKGPVGNDAQGEEKPDDAREVGEVRMEQSVAEMDNLMNGTITQLFQRKSVRAFEPLPIDPAIRDLLFESALQAPTAGNQTLHTILDITDPVLKAELAELCDHQPFIATAPLVLIFLADGRRWLEMYRAAGCEPRAQGPGDALLAMADAVIAAQNLVVAAHSLGLGSCYIGDILENCEQVRARLQLPDDVFPAAMLVIGWPTAQQQARRKPDRFAREQIVCENTYRETTPDALRQMYLNRLERSRAARNLSGQESDAPVDFNTQLRAFWARKYESNFALEMNRSAAEYMKAFHFAENG